MRMNLSEREAEQRGMSTGLWDILRLNQYVSSWLNNGVDPIASKNDEILTDRSHIIADTDEGRRLARAFSLFEGDPQAPIVISYEQSPDLQSNQTYIVFRNSLDAQRSMRGLVQTDGLSRRVLRIDYRDGNAANTQSSKPQGNM